MEIGIAVLIFLIGLRLLYIESNLKKMVKAQQETNQKLDEVLKEIKDNN
ncbi:MAG TPA: hypothetical protein VFT51_12425 [Bacillales bacterium]|nr:hypothetical protein [Bacillales bacterium]